MLLLLGATGCPNDSLSTDCVPACANGFTCMSGTCVPGDMVDMEMVHDDGGGGACNPACGGLTPYCNASGHCVACTMDTQCPNGKFCDIRSDTMAVCAVGCNGDDRCGGGNMKCCNKACVDTGSDPNNCGGCAMPCSANHAKATCVGGQCQSGTCDFGYDDCNMDPKDGCEVNLHVDPNNCTSCGNSCSLKNAIPGCADGCYIAACNFGFDDCNQDSKDGCETPVLTDQNNCGGCGIPCKALPNAAASCTAGNCVLGACMPGFANCNNNPMDGCEADLTSDPNNCNSCGVVCPQQNPFCNKGVCGQVPPAVTWTGMFTQGQSNQNACNDWNTWRASILPGPYNTITIKGSNDNVGVSCTGAGAQQLCQALKNNQAININCNNRTWATGTCGSGIELTSSAGVCQCNTGYTARPCIGNGNPNWGGVNTTTCSGPTQTITVLCQQ